MRKEIIESENESIKNLDAAKKIVNNKKYSDIEKFIDFNIYTDKDSNQYLEEFPEYLAGYIPFATNTGLMCFYNKAKSILVVYDLTEEEKDINLNSITPDTSFFADYNYISIPVNIRKINYKDTNFIADKSFTYNGNTYSFFNCDKIKNVAVDNNGYFKTSSSVNTISYEFKPVISIRAFTNNGEKNTSLNIQINDINMDVNGNIYSYDCSKLLNNNIQYLLKFSGTVDSKKLKINQNDISFSQINNTKNYKMKINPKNIKENIITNFPDLILSLNNNNTIGYLEVM